MVGTAHQDRHLRTDGLGRDLLGRSVRGGAIVLTVQGCKFVVVLGSTAILARILTPEDFGLLAMVTAVTAFLARFKDLGLATSTVQCREIDHEQISTLFWVNAGFGFLTMLVTFAIAPAVAWLYGEPRLTEITFALAFAFVFGGLTVQHQALLRRRMQFAVLAIIDIASLLLGVIAAIVSACSGAGYWALVIMQLVIAFGTGVGVWLGCGWRPGRPLRHSGVRPMIAFGGHLTGFNIMNYFTRNLDHILIGWYWGSGLLGLYARAYQLLLVPIQQVNTPISGVAIPTLSRLQDDPERYRAYFQKGVLLLASMAMPLVGFMLLTADKLVLTVLGPQWPDCVPIFRVLGPVALLSTFNVAAAWACISSGKTRRLYRFEIFAAIAFALAFAAGLPWGPVGVAAACSITYCAVRPAGVVYCLEPTCVRISDLLRAQWRPALATVMACVFLYSAGAIARPPGGVLLELAVDLVAFISAYVVAWVILPNGRKIGLEMMHLLASLRRSPQKPAMEMSNSDCVDPADPSGRNAVISQGPARSDVSEATSAEGDDPP